jgi:hypothetical protein
MLKRFAFPQIAAIESEKKLQQFYNQMGPHPVSVTIFYAL